MNTIDTIGSIGVGLVLLAYFLNSFHIIKEGKKFFMLNIVGSALACYASCLINYIPFIILEGVWCMVSCIAFIKTFKK
jgi:hypothetical protein